MDNQRYIQEREGQIQFNLGEARAANETTLQQLRNTQATVLTNLENRNSQLLQTNQSAGMMYSNSMLAIGAIFANADIPADAKQGLVDKQLQLLTVGMDSIKAISGLDIDVVTGIGGGGTGGGAVTDPATGATTAPPSMGTPTAIPGSTWVKQPDGSWRSVSDTNPGGDNLTPTGPGGINSETGPNITPTATPAPTPAPTPTPTGTQVNVGDTSGQQGYGAIQNNPTIDSIMSNFSSGKVTQEQGVAQLVSFQAQSGMSDADLANYIGVDLPTWMSAKVGTTEVSR